MPLLDGIAATIAQIPKPTEQGEKPRVKNKGGGGSQCKDEDGNPTDNTDECVVHDHSKDKGDKSGEGGDKEGGGGFFGGLKSIFGG